jgi:hypothetical protein
MRFSAVASCFLDRIFSRGLRGLNLRNPLCILLILCAAGPLHGQDTTHIFPQFADGRFSDGTFYRSTLMILPWFAADAPNCTLSLFGLTANFEGGLSGSAVPINLAAGGFAAIRTTGLQPFQGGYAALTCDKFVFASLLYGFHAANGSLIGQATVFSSKAFFESRLIADHRDGARIGIAISNVSDVAQTYDVSFVSNGVTRTSTISVPGRRSLARFLDEILDVAPGAVGIATLKSTTLTDFATIALRYTGGVFTTIPGN